MNQVGEALDRDHIWEDEEFGDEDYWVVGSLQAVHRAPPGLPIPSRTDGTLSLLTTTKTMSPIM